jgi:hypothetical protein
MAKQQSATRKRSQRASEEDVEPAAEQNGQEPESYEQELTEYLQERIKPGLNSGAIPLLARSIARELVQREPPEDEELEDEEYEAEDDVEGEADEDYEAEEGEDEYEEGEEDPDAEAEEEPDLEAEEEPDLESELRDLQAELGEDWILRFSVQGDDAWLTAEKEDGSQRIEAPTTDVIADAVELLNESGGRSA